MDDFKMAIVGIGMIIGFVLLFGGVAVSCGLGIFKISQRLLRKEKHDDEAHNTQSKIAP